MITTVTAAMVGGPRIARMLKTGLLALGRAPGACPGGSWVAGPVLGACHGGGPCPGRASRMGAALAADGSAVAGATCRRAGW
ncbi:MAG: hypothetical protein JO345_20495 [Streptosporangiaceae bacterium]|nr:hypothetical protein [Streptosporangiaceae bacterium]